MFRFYDMESSTQFLEALGRRMTAVRAVNGFRVVHKSNSAGPASQSEAPLLNFICYNTSNEETQAI